MDLEDFSVTKVLGKGGWGTVMYAERKRDSYPMVLKRIGKSYLLGSKEDNNCWEKSCVYNEQNILQELSAIKWFTKLLMTRDTPYYLYMGLEFYQGGDLRNYQNEVGVISEEVTCFIISEIIVAVETLHKNGILHRDLKKENILFSKNGHVVLCDFGLSIHLNHEEYCKSRVGTQGYMAPEVIKGHKYGFASDLWSVGVIFVELCTGYNPFYPENDCSPDEFKRITNHNSNNKSPRIKRRLSANAIDIINLLLAKDDKSRASIKAIKSRKFFENVLWNEIEKQSQPSIIKFDFNGNDDFRNFPDCIILTSTVILSMNVYDGQITFSNYNYELKVTKRYSQKFIDELVMKHELEMAKIKKENQDLEQRFVLFKQELETEREKWILNLEGNKRGEIHQNNAELEEASDESKNKKKIKKRVICNYCQKELSDYASLRRHKNAKHENKKTKICPNCEKSFTTNQQLNAHYTRKHKNHYLCFE